MNLAQVKSSRRAFLKVASVGAAVGVVAPAAVFVAGCSTAWVQTVLNDLPTVVNIVGSIVAVISTATGNGALNGVVGAAITVAVNALTASLKAFQDAVNAYNSNKSTGLNGVIAALQAAQTDAQKVIATLPAGTVSTTVQTIIVAAIGTVITVLSSIQAIIPGAAPAAVTAKATAAAVSSKISVPNAAALKAGYNSVLWLHGYSQLQVQ